MMLGSAVARRAGDLYAKVKQKEARTHGRATANLVNAAVSFGRLKCTQIHQSQRFTHSKLLGRVTMLGNGSCGPMHRPATLRCICFQAPARGQLLLSSRLYLLCFYLLFLPFLPFFSFLPFLVFAAASAAMSASA